MKTFLVRGKRPIIRWGSLPNEIYFEGTVPEGYKLAISPGKEDNYVIVDVDRHGDIDGFKNVPIHLYNELDSTLNYDTKNYGKHYWFKYTGEKPLANKASGLGIDLRTNKGYVIWYHNKDIRECLDKINETSQEMNEWLEKLFSYVNKSKSN